MTLASAPASTTEYSVQGAGTNDVKYVTFGSGLSANDEVVIYRVVEVLRDTEFAITGVFSISALNEQFNRLVAMVQDRRDVSDRSLRLALSDPATPSAGVPVPAPPPAPAPSPTPAAEPASTAPVFFIYKTSKEFYIYHP